MSQVNIEQVIAFLKGLQDNICKALEAGRWQSIIC